MAPPKPHMLGLLRPQLKHVSSLTPTSLPHEEQRAEPDFCRSNIFGGILALRRGAPRSPQALVPSPEICSPVRGKALAAHL